MSRVFNDLHLDWPSALPTYPHDAIPAQAARRLFRVPWNFGGGWRLSGGVDVLIVTGGCDIFAYLSFACRSQPRQLQVAVDAADLFARFELR